MNLLLTLGAGILAFFIGTLWYTVFIGKSWIIGSGMTEEKIKEQGGAGISMVSTLVYELFPYMMVSIHFLSMMENYFLRPILFL